MTSHGARLPAAVTPRSLPATLDERFATLGVAIIEHALGPADLAQLDAAFPKLAPGMAGVRSAGFAMGEHAALVANATLAAVAARLADRPMQLTRALALDKSPAANWFVPWHQDRAENGRDRPVAELEQIVTLRIHLDDSDESNGPLEVVPGSHVDGRLDRDAIAALCRAVEPLLCLALRGDILVMRPLLVHRSQRARKPAARRVLHLEYAPADTGRFQ